MSESRILDNMGASSLTLSVELEELDALINEVRQIREDNIKIFQELTR